MRVNKALPAFDYWRLTPPQLYSKLSTKPAGLSEKEASSRLASHGPNELPGKRVAAWEVWVRQFKSPLIWMLAAASIVAALLGDVVDAAIILAILLLSGVLSFYDEYRSERTVEELARRVSFKAVVMREGVRREIPVRELVPGDIVVLSPGSVVPADLRLAEAENLEVNEATLTGESLPAVKHARILKLVRGLPSQLANCAFMGTVVVSGDGLGVVVSTGGDTQFGQIAREAGRKRPVTEFERGLSSFGSMLMRVILVLTLTILVVNSLLRHNYLESLLFALAVAVGLIPELLPAVLTVNLSKGAREMARKNVVVRRLSSIEDFGNMDTLCTDKTGTLTEGTVVVIHHLDLDGKESREVLACSVVCNSAREDRKTTNPLDAAIWEHATRSGALSMLRHFSRIADLPFDYERKRMSTVVRKDGKTLLLTKGAADSVMAVCSHARLNGREVEMGRVRAKLHERFVNYSNEGYRVLAVAERPIAKKARYTESDERKLTLVGFILLLDPPKHDAKASVLSLHELGVGLKILTGDNEHVTMKVASEVGLQFAGSPVLGAEIEKMNDAQLRKAVEANDVFARLTPAQKLRVVGALRANGRVVGFLGDGVNDAPALRAADVGVSVEGGVDAAKEAADIVLLHKSLHVLATGVSEGRRVFSNTLKYVYMMVSSNFGNMFSVVGASFFLKFLPMTPSQILLNNALYDISELTIPTDNVDPAELKRPRKWDTKFIRKFMLVFGPLSSIYDFLTFGVLLFVFNATPALFQTGWFVESIATQTMVIFVLRTHGSPFWKSRPSNALILSSFAVVAAAIALPFTPLGAVFGFVPLPLEYFAFLAVAVLTYLGLVEFAKRRFYAQYEANRLSGRA